MRAGLLGVVVAVLAVAAGGLGWYLFVKGPPSLQGTDPAGPSAGTHVADPPDELHFNLSPDEVARLGILTQTLSAASRPARTIARGILKEDLSRTATIRASSPGVLRAWADSRWPAVGDIVIPPSILGIIEVQGNPSDTRPARQETADTATAPGEVEPQLLRVDVPGRIVHAAVHPGQSVEAGQIIFRMVRYDQLLAEVTLDRPAAIDDSAGEIRIEAVGHESWPLKGKLVTVPDATATAGNERTVVLAVASEGYPLSPGMPVSAHLPLRNQQVRGVVVPPLAVIEHEGRTWVWVRVSEGAFRRQAVRLGELLKGGWFVAEGLSPGQAVVVRGGPSLLALQLKGRSESGL